MCRLGGVEQRGETKQHGPAVVARGQAELGHENRLGAFLRSQTIRFRFGKHHVADLRERDAVRS